MWTSMLVARVFWNGVWVGILHFLGKPTWQWVEWMNSTNFTN